MNITVVSEPPFEPVTLLEVYAQLRLTPDHAGSPGEQTHPDDDLLTSHIATARKFVEQATRRSLIQQTLRLSDAEFPVHCYGGWPWTQRARVRHLYLRRPPFVRVESVRYYDADNDLQTVAAADYYVTDSLVPELRFVTGFVAPTLYDRPDAVRVDYVTGYTPANSPAESQDDYAANVPEGLKNAVLLGVQLLYDDLADSDRAAIERLRESLLQPFRIQL